MDVSGLSINLEVEEVERQIMQQQQQRRGSANIISSGGPSSAEMAVEMHRQIVEQLESTVSNLPSGSTGVINIEVSLSKSLYLTTTTYKYIILTLNFCFLCLYQPTKHELIPKRYFSIIRIEIH